MNEELQSTNEELQTINVELSDPSAEVSQANAFLASILAFESQGRRRGLLDWDFLVRVWNEKSADSPGSSARNEVLGKKTS